MANDSDTTAVSPPLGSAAWINASDYEEGDVLHSRATYFLAAINWEGLCKLAGTLRGGVHCHVSENYSLGHFNMVRALEFSDGTTWIARLRLPELGAVFGSREALDPARAMESEIATMKLLRLRTSIPVPKVFHYDAASSNDIGAPYILMSYIHGNTASDQRVTLDSPVGQFGNPTQDLNFRKQMARIQVELSCLKFDKIGAVYQDGDDFTIGPELQTGLGPWDDEMDYYRTISQHLLAVANEQAETEVKEAEAFTEVPKLFKRLMGIFSAKAPREKEFRLANRDFGAHNLLVDGDLNIVGLIDFDGVLAAPFPVVAQFPQLTGLDRPVPGYVETRPIVLERMAREEPQLREYRALVVLAEGRLNGGNKEGPSIAETLFSDISCIVEGMQNFGMHSASVNNQWKAAFETFLEKYSRNDR